MTPSADTTPAGAKADAASSPPRGKAFRAEDVPGFREALEQAKISEFTCRADAWWLMTYLVAGFKLRTMTVEDYEILLRENCPLLARQVPSPDELVLFLWWLSPEFERWNKGWRKYFPTLRKWARGRFERECWKVLKLEELTRAAGDWLQEHPEELYEAPEEHPFSKCVAACLQYIDLMFYDRPPSMGNKSADAGVYFLTDWFCKLQREFSLPTREIETMAIPQLLARLKEIRQWHDAGNKTPSFSQRQDDLHRQIQAALMRGMTPDDLMAGKLKFN